MFLEFWFADEGKFNTEYGKELKLTDSDELPAINGQAVKAGNVKLPALSISFITFEEAGKK